MKHSIFVISLAVFGCVGAFAHGQVPIETLTAFHGQVPIETLTSSQG